MPTELSPAEIDAQFDAQVADSFAKDSAAQTATPPAAPAATTEPVTTPPVQPQATAAPAEPTAPAQPAAPQPTPGQQAQADFFARLEQRGLTGIRDKYKDEDALAEGVINAQRMLGKRSEYEDYGRYLVQTAALPEDQRREAAKRLITQVLGLPIDEAQPEPQPQPQPPAQPAKPDNGFGLPEWSEKWEHQFRYDREKNQWVTVDPEADPADLQKYLHALSARKQFLADPNRYLKPLVEQQAQAMLAPLRQEIDQTRQQFVQQQQSQQAAYQAAQLQSLLHQIKPWASDGVDPMTGAVRMTELGQRLDTHVAALVQRGYPADAALREALWAMESYGLLRNGQPVQVAAPVTPAAPAVPKNKAPAVATAPVTPATALSGTVAPPLGSDTSFEDAMTRAMQLDGIQS